MDDHVFNVLFLCNTNAARSILAEAQLNALGHGQFKAFSAGSRPAKEVDPLALDFLQKVGISIEGLRSKPWDEFAAPGAPTMDYVITLCDEAAGESCPVWPGHPVSAHWSVADPLGRDGGEEEKRQAIKNVANGLHKRTELFVALPLKTLDHMSLRSSLADIGKAS